MPRVFHRFAERSFGIGKPSRSIVSAVVVGAGAVLAVVAAVNGEEGVLTHQPAIDVQRLAGDIP
jgi:hypothetical protein